MAEIVKLTGMKELEQALRQIGNVAKNRRIGFKALRAGGEPIAETARSLVAVDDGDLRDSIDVLPTLAKSQRGDKGAVAPLEMHVGPGQHPQAIATEFGTAPHYIRAKPGGVLGSGLAIFGYEVHHPGTAPQPFMRPAWEQQRMTALDLIGAVLWREVNKQAAKAPKG